MDSVQCFVLNRLSRFVAHMMKPAIPSRILRQSAWRTFLLQASWNFERLQGLGALFILAPALRYLYLGDVRKEAFKRHLGYFNTHPFLASSVLGTAIAMEESASRGEVSEVSAVDFSSIMMAPYAAMGDAFFWGGVRPLAVVVGLFFAARGSVWACLAVLLIFNLPHLYFRLGGFFRGYREGVGMIETIQRWHLPDLAIRLKEATVILLGGLCATWLYFGLGREGSSPLWGLLALPVMGLCGWLARKGVSTLMLVLTGGAVLLVLGSFL